MCIYSEYPFHGKQMNICYLQSFICIVLLMATFLPSPLQGNHLSAVINIFIL